MLRSMRLIQKRTIVVYAMAIFMAGIAMPANSAYAGEKPEIFVQLGHSDSINVVAISPDGRYALSGSRDRTAKLWEISTGKEIRTIKQNDDVNSVAFSPDGRKMLIGSSSHLEIWDLQTGVRTVEFKGKMASLPIGRYIPGGRQVIGVQHEFNISLWDVFTGELVRSFDKSHSAKIRSIAVSPDGRYAASGGGTDGKDTKIRLWDVATGKEIRRFSGHNENIETLAFSPDGKHLLSGSGIGNSLIVLWEVASGKEIWRYQFDSRSVVSVAFSPDGENALSAYSYGDMILHDVMKGSEIAHIETSSVNDAIFAPDGKTIISANSRAKPPATPGRIEKAML